MVICLYYWSFLLSDRDIESLTKHLYGFVYTKKVKLDWRRYLCWLFSFRLLLMVGNKAYLYNILSLASFYTEIYFSCLNLSLRWFCWLYSLGTYLETCIINNSYFQLSKTPWIWLGWVIQVRRGSIGETAGQATNKCKCNTVLADFCYSQLMRCSSRFLSLISSTVIKIVPDSTSSTNHIPTEYVLYSLSDYVEEGEDGPELLEMQGRRLSWWNEIKIVFLDLEQMARLWHVSSLLHLTKP